MKFKNFRKKAVAGLLTGALLVCSVGSALAADSEYDPYGYAPETTVDVKANILSGATAAANTPVLSMLGINVTCSDSVGVVGNDSDNPLNLLVFGSSLNESADPYLANYYYYYATYGYPGTYSTSTYSGWTTGAYSLVSSYAKSGPTGASNNTTTIDISANGATKNCNPLFFYEPDVLLGSSTSSYNTGLTNYQSTVNSSYSPLVLDGWSTGSGGYCMNDGTFASTESMANGVYTIATSIEATYGSTKTGRYGSVADCGATYANFAMGIYYYAQYAFANKILSPVTYCTNLTVNSSDSYTVAAGSGRVAQYAYGLGEEAEAGTYTLDELAEAVNVVISSSLSDDEIEVLEKAGITVVDNTMPDTVYGTSMQAPDNILGTAYYFALMYSDQLAALKDEDGNSIGISLTPADVTAYFVENIYHVSADVKDSSTGETGVEIVLDFMMNGLDVGSEITCDYNSVINAMIATGADYYNDCETVPYTWDSVSTVS